MLIVIIIIVKYEEVINDIPDQHFAVFHALLCKLSFQHLSLTSYHVVDSNNEHEFTFHLQTAVRIQSLTQELEKLNSLKLQLESKLHVQHSEIEVLI